MRSTRLDQLDKEGATRNAIRVADRLRELIHQHYRENLKLQDYASRMAVSPTQLRAACVAATGTSPDTLIHARLITEAKRNLIFGDMSIEQIAYGLVSWIRLTARASSARRWGSRPASSGRRRGNWCRRAERRFISDSLNLFA